MTENAACECECQTAPCCKEKSCECCKESCCCN